MWKYSLHLQTLQGLLQQLAALGPSQGSQDFANLSGLQLTTSAAKQRSGSSDGHLCRMNPRCREVRRSHECLQHLASEASGLTEPPRSSRTQGGLARNLATEVLSDCWVLQKLQVEFSGKLCWASMIRSKRLYREAMPNRLELAKCLSDV